MVEVALGHNVMGAWQHTASDRSQYPSPRGAGTVGNTVSLIGDLVEYGRWLVARETGHVCNWSMGIIRSLVATIGGIIQRTWGGGSYCILL